MSDNIVKSTDVAPKKQGKLDDSATDKNKNTEETQEENSTKVKKNSTKKKTVDATPGKKLVYFSSGSSYITKDGFRFSKDKRIYELDIEEADFLLSLDNFRLPDQLELEDYYKENN
jgi:hypothetical protein